MLYIFGAVYMYMYVVHILRCVYVHVCCTFSVLCICTCMLYIFSAVYMYMYVVHVRCSYNACSLLSGIILVFLLHTVKVFSLFSYWDLPEHTQV